MGDTNVIIMCNCSISSTSGTGGRYKAILCQVKGEGANPWT